MYTFGSQTDVDCVSLTKILTHLSGIFNPVKMLEIGFFTGETARGSNRVMDDLGKGFEYWGIDPGIMAPVVPPFNGAKVVQGDSIHCFKQVPDDFSFVFIDGCHCINHCCLDILHYRKKVSVGGILALHDAAPGVQGRDRQLCGPDWPEFYIATLKAIELLRFPWDEYELFMNDYNPVEIVGGIIAYKRKR